MSSQGQNFSDVLIIGAGVTGLNTAWNYKKQMQAHSVTILDQVPTKANSLQASSVNCGILCAESISGSVGEKTMLRLTQELARELGDEVKFVETGMLSPCYTKEQVEWAQQIVKTENLAGYGPDEIRFVNREEALKIEPSLSKNVVGGMYNAKTGHCNPKHFLRAIYKRCLEIGVEINLDESVRDIQYDEQKDQYTVVVKKLSKTYHCKKLVIATGAASYHIGQMLGVSIPVVPTRGTMWSTKPLPQGTLKTIIFSAEGATYWKKHNKALMQKGIPPRVSHAYGSRQRMTHHLYLKQTHDGCIIAGGDRVVVNVNEVPNQYIDMEKVESNKKFATMVLPMLKDHKVERTWTGLMPFTPDGAALIGQINCLKGQVYIISGLASHGMMMGPGASKLLAGLMCGDKNCIELLHEDNPDRVIKPTQIFTQQLPQARM